MHPTSPALTYYTACRGRWRAPVSIVVTDAEALRRSGMSALDRLSVRLLAVWPAWLGRVYLETTVDMAPGEGVVHTTVVRWLGLPLQRSVETYAIDPDGARFIVSGGMEGAGAVDPSAVCATYTLRWLGVEIRQRTELDGDVVRVWQEGPGFRGIQELVRLGG